jgi:hypothetical protein
MFRGGIVHPFSPKLALGVAPFTKEVAGILFSRFIATSY